MNNVSLDRTCVEMYCIHVCRLHITNVFAVKFNVVYLIWCFWGIFTFS